VSWKETCPMQERVRFVEEWVEHKSSFAELCLVFGVSRKTGYKWLERFRGATGMTNRSEVRILTWGPDAGNPTPMRQGLCIGAPVLSQRDANAARPVKEGPVEVVGA